MTMEQELIEDLTVELKIDDATFNAELLATKVKGAIRDVKSARRYPSGYGDERIDSDMQNYYSQCRAIALYDYNKVGADFEKSNSESGESRSWVDRNSLFSGVLPLARY